MRLFCAIGIAMLLTVPASAATITVTPAPDTSIDALQRAIDAAADGDTLLVAPGHYHARPDTFVEKLCGNCAEHQTDVDATSGYEITDKALAIIGDDPATTILHTHAGYGVYFLRSRGSLLTRVRVTHGKRDLDGNATDAAVVAKHSTVTVTDCDIIENPHFIDSIVVGVGGVFGRENSELTIVGNRIIETGWDGIALYRGAQAFIADNEIRRGRGAGIGITWDATATVLRNRVSGFWKGIGSFGATRVVARNNAVFHCLGWGIIATGTSHMDCANNVIFSNGNCGFGLWGPEARGRMTNNVIVANGWRDQWVCPCVGVWNYGHPIQFPMTHNLIWGNVAGEVKDMPDPIDSEGNISVDPLIDTLTFVPRVGSPLIDAGNPELTDPDGTVSDIGLTGGPNARRR